MFSVNNLRLGTITATDYCLGSVPVQKMYLGSVLVFDRTPAATITYSDITITDFSYDGVVPASGGTATPTVTYSQTFGYNGATTGGGTITSGATLLFAGGAVNASNGQYTYTSKGKELSELTDTQVTVTVSLNGKTKTATANASQAANTRTWSSLKAEYNDNTDFENPAYIAGADGKIILGTAANDKITAYVNIYKIWTYTSGSTSKEAFNNTTILTDANWIHDNGKSESDFIVDNRGTTLGDERTGSVWVIVDDMKSNVANVLQKANLITDTQYTEWTITQSNIDNVSAEGDTITINPSIKRTKTDTYTSTATKLTEETSTEFTLQSNQSWAVVAGKNINVSLNTGGERSATITITSNGKSTTFTITQSTGLTITSYGDITINGGSATDIPASGGTVKASGCTATIQVTYSSGSTGTVTVPTSNITYTEVNAASLGTTVKARTKVGTSTCNVSYQGKSASKLIDVYQAANTATYTDLTIVNPQVSGDIPASGGSMSATYLKITIEIEYSSGETSTDEVTPSEANILSTKVTAASLGTTEKVRTKVGTSTISASYGGLSVEEDVDVYQLANTKAAGSIAYGDWIISVSANPTTVSATGGTSTITTSAYRTRKQNYSFTSGATSQEAMSNETGTPTLSSNQTWCTLSNNNATISRNDTTSSRTVTITGTHQGKSDTCTITQSARQVESYGDINISGGSVNGDIPASGGSKSASGCTATIRVNYDNDTYLNVSVPSSNISYSSVSGSNLGTTSKARTKVGTSRCTVSYQGKTATKDFDVYQLANSSTATDIDYGTWQVSVSANPTSVAAGGGTSTITRSATRTRKQNYTWTSGATSQSDLSNETATPTLSVSGTGFLLDGTTVTATSNVPARTYTLQVSNPTGDLEEGPDQELTTTVTSTYTQPSSNSRSCTVTATHGGVSKQVTISLSGQSQSSGNQDWTVAKGTNMQTATKNGNTLTMVPNAEYGNKNETYTATCTVTQTTSNKTQIVLGRWYKGYLNVSPTTLEFDSNGGTKTINIDTNLNWKIVPQ